MNNDSRIVHSNRNYTSLLCYQKALVVYDLTYHFCERFLDKRDRTYDQMIQAARSGKQNIVEGVVDLSTSFEMVIKLLNVSRGSLAELRRIIWIIFAPGDLGFGRMVQQRKKLCVALEFSIVIVHTSLR